MNKKDYQTPDILVNELQLEGVLCQSTPTVSAASIEAWGEEEFTW